MSGAVTAFRQLGDKVCVEGVRDGGVKRVGWVLQHLGCWEVEVCGVGGGRDGVGVGSCRVRWDCSGWIREKSWVYVQMIAGGGWAMSRRLGSNDLGQKRKEYRVRVSTI